MVKNSEQAKFIAIQLFISSDDESCTAVKDYLETWLTDQDDSISLEIIPILDNPIRLIQTGINYTPALIINGTVISQSCSIDDVKTLLSDISQFLD